MKKLFTFCLLVVLWVVQPIAAYSTPDEPKIISVSKEYSAGDIAEWTPATVDAAPCLISAAIGSPFGCEVNFHKVKVHFTGAETVKMSIGYSDKPELQNVIEKSYLHTRFQPLKSGGQIEVTSKYKGQRYAWLMLPT